MISAPFPLHRKRYAVILAVCATCALTTATLIVGTAVYPRTFLSMAVVQPKTLDSNKVADANTLWELFQIANPALMTAISPKQGAHVVFVMGGAGEGKSYIRDRLMEMNPKPLLRRLCRRQGDACAAHDGLTFVRKPELIYGLKGEYAFNNMDAIEKDKFKGGEFFADFDKQNLVLVDDLDEIHPESVTWFLDVLCDFAANLNSNTQIVVFGRPEAFYAFYAESNAEGRAALSGSVVLEFPTYLTKHEYSLHATDWAAFMARTQHSEIKNAEQIADRIFDYSQRWSWVSESMRQLYLANFLAESIWRQPKWSEKELKKRVVAAIVDRAHTTHNRPELANELYHDLILRIANDSAGRIDPTTGCFTTQDWSIAAKPGDLDKGDIRVHRVLSLSGLAKLQPANWVAQQWRFEPLWLHEYFVDEYNKKRYPHWWLTVCYMALLVATPGLVLALGLFVRPQSQKKHQGGGPRPTPDSSLGAH